MSLPSPTRAEQLGRSEWGVRASAVPEAFVGRAAGVGHVQQRPEPGIASGEGGHCPRSGGFLVPGEVEGGETYSRRRSAPTIAPSVETSEWMERAAVAARGLRATSVGKPGATHSVYVVLLHNTARRHPFGLYVGQTSRDPDLRFDQHKAGYKASRAVKRFGVRLLPELVAHLNPITAWEAIELEGALAEAFRRASVPWVEGGH